MLRRKPRGFWLTDPGQISTGQSENVYLPEQGSLYWKHPELIEERRMLTGQRAALRGLDELSSHVRGAGQGVGIFK